MTERMNAALHAADQGGGSDWPGVVIIVAVLVAIVAIAWADR